jgi:Ribosomal protein S3, C-terminal domain
MGQKTNPNILQLSKTNEWDSKYIEKTSKDFYLHTQKDLETKKFINNFFRNKGLIIQNCKLNYSNSNLSIFINYHQSSSSINNINEINKKQKLYIKREDFVSTKNKLKKHYKVLKSIQNSFNYKNLIYRKDLLKKKIAIKKIVNKIKRLKAINYYKKYLSLKNNKTIKNSLSKEFLKILLNSLSEFYKGLNNITLILKPLNNNLYKSLNKKQFLKIKKKLVTLRKYQRNEFFKEGIGIAFSVVTNRNSSELLSKYIAANIKKLKRHNFFLRFLKELLTIFIAKSLVNKIKGIKIKVKGRINGAPRAKNKIITIGKSMALFTIDSSINYFETTAYTINGTLGVKVWICEKN